MQYYIGMLFTVLFMKNDFLPTSVLVFIPLLVLQCCNTIWNITLNVAYSYLDFSPICLLTLLLTLKTMWLRSTQILWGCLITWLQSADLGPFSSYKRHIKNIVDVSVSSKTLRRIRTHYIAKNWRSAYDISMSFNFP